MILALLLATLQAAAPETEAATPSAETPAEEQSVATEAAPAEPPRKRVCRTVVDTRTGIIGKRSKVCRFLDEAPSTTD